MGFYKINPVTTRTKGIGWSNNFYLIPCFEFGCQRDHATVDFSTCRSLTYLGMNFICEVDWHRILRQFPYRTIRSEDINSFCKNVFLDRIYKGLCISTSTFLKFDQIINPTQFFFRSGCLTTTLIGPVCCNPVLCNLVHLYSTNLKFDWTFRPIYSRMNGLVTICFLICDVIFKSSWHWFPQLMYVT